jgi:hypothetical protein
MDRLFPAPRPQVDEAAKFGHSCISIYISANEKRLCSQEEKQSLKLGIMMPTKKETQSGWGVDCARKNNPRSMHPIVAVPFDSKVAYNREQARIFRRPDSSLF